MPIIFEISVGGYVAGISDAVEFYHGDDECRSNGSNLR